MDTERIERIKKAMARDNLDALVLRLPENVLFLSGHWPLCGWSFLFFPLEGKPVCIVPHCDEKEAREELWEADCRSFLFGVLSAGNPYQDIARLLKESIASQNLLNVGYEGSFESVAPPWNAAEPAIPANVTRDLLESVFGKDQLVDATDLLHQQRACKTDQELENLRRANEIACFGLKAFCESVEVGVRGIDLVGRVENTILTQGTGYKGARRVRSFAQVSTGASETAVGYRPMVISTNKPMASGDLALLELGVIADGFWADRTRVRVAGAPSKKQTDIFEIIKRAQEAAIAKVCQGVSAGEVDEAARAIVREAGYDKEFVHVTGHGIGIRYHEPTPLIAPGIDLVLQQGMVHSMEPGIYHSDIGGIRLEENVAVTATGAEVLGPFAKEFCQ